MNPNIISYIKHVLYDRAFLDIKRASTGGSKIGAFILASCFIDYMAGFLRGGPKEVASKDYKEFVRRFLPSYDSEKLYTDLRCKLVHNYSEGGSYILKYGDPSLHGRIINNKTTINLENFIDDLENAFSEFMKHIECDRVVEQKVIERYNSVGLLCAGGIAPKKV